MRLPNQKYPLRSKEEIPESDRLFIRFPLHNGDGRVELSRRGFIGAAGLAAVSAAVGMTIPFGRNLREGFIPAVMAESTATIAGKDGLIVLNDRPLNAETPAYLLNDPITPTERHFIRNNGIPPEDTDSAKWMLTVDGLVENPMKLSIADLKYKFEVIELALQLECAGNGRAYFVPPARGNQWTLGAIGCSKWTGVRLSDVLKGAGLRPNAIYTAHEGADAHLSGDESKLPISRGLPIKKAMDSHNLIAFQQNGKDIHPMHGAPVRLVVPGWPGSCSQKWLRRIWVRDVVHDGAKMTGTSYRVPHDPVAPGQKVPVDDFVIIQSMPVKSLITRPKTDLETKDRTIEVGGHAWAGDRIVKRLDVSIDFGATWKATELDDPINPFAWQNWRANVTFPTPGYFEVWSRATDDKGDMQPFAISWNPKGYLNNTMHRIAVRVS
ncbi:MAG: sulfite oxidase [Hyphomicrobium sp.]|nr:sulfite oxidase [Hyphomicrobium sp.]